MANPMISVIMSVYNDEKYVEKAIVSILNQTYRDFEFIIINDGSSDSSLEIIRSYEKKDPRIIVVNQQNIGLTKSLNKAIKLSKGSYIARMDSDDISGERRLEKQHHFLQYHISYGLIGTNIVKIDSSDEIIEENKTKYSHEEIVQTLKTRNCIAHGSVMINKELLGDMLCYDESFLYAQDYRLWAKIAKKYKVQNLKESLYKLRLHELSISKQKIEKQSIYAGIVAYEFETDKKVNTIEEEIVSNKELRKKIGLILLMNFESRIAKQYFSKFDIFYYITSITQFFDLRKIKFFVNNIRIMNSGD